MRLLRLVHIALFCIWTFCAGISWASPVSPTEKINSSTYSLMGTLGLNTIPSSRMDDPGTINFTISTLDPYIHGTLGMQITDGLYLALRQTAESSSIAGSADRLYPGLDIKMRLLTETAWRPELSVGLQSAIGHKRMAGEYLAVSKRYKDFDMTAGIGWGRLGSAGQISNPLKAFGSHFGKTRSLDGERPNEVNDWFTGDTAGLFAGIEYHTPFDGLSLKADWGADRYTAEKALMPDFKTPETWSAGLAFQPSEWFTIGAAIAGGDKIMGSLSLRAPIKKWPLSYSSDEKPALFRKHRTDLALPGAMEDSAAREDIELHHASIKSHTASGLLEATPYRSLPQQIGRTARHMANHAGQDVEEITIMPVMYGLRGPAIRLMRRDLEQALAHNNGSPQEIWRNAAINTDPPEGFHKPGIRESFRNYLLAALPSRPRLVLDHKTSLSEEDHGILYRTSLILEEVRRLSTHILTGGALRLNVKDNLQHLNDFRLPILLPTRGNEDRFAAQTVALDRLYISRLTSIAPDFHLALTAGHLEEMYSGLGGEVLYRPFGKRFAVGAETWLALKRDPGTRLNLGLSGDHLLTGHINAWYEIPDSDLTIHGSIGRYLAEDIGATLALEKHMTNGVKIRGFVTATDQADFDIFGGTTHLYSGLQLTMPLGSLPFLPNGSAIKTSFAPLGRNTGQRLDNPLPLYAISEPLSLRHISTHWTDITE